ncbi:uncharacterized protein [Palaemon carinicauda]|uniref:uncharacterized protein n=1 Tax=Palaemon carinicauda TaxID=392227 RepID=UPI0035B59D90
MSSLIAVCKTEDIDVVLLQKILLTARRKLKIKGYNATTPQIGTDKGLATLVKTSIPTTRLHNLIPCGTNVETLAVTITLLNQKIYIYNIYRKINREDTGELQVTQLFAHAKRTPTIICGDFNVHHPILSSSSMTNPSGEHIAFALEEFEGIALLNTGQPTHLRGGRLDMTFVTTAIRHLTKWQVHSTLISDHFATVTELEMQQLPPIPPPPPRWNQELADWVCFRLAIEEWVVSYIPPEDIDQLEKDLVDAFHNAANRVMPLKATGGNYTYKDSWYYCPEIRRLKTRLNSHKNIQKKVHSRKQRTTANSQN